MTSRITEAAATDLETIAAYISSQSDPAVARRVIDRIAACITALAQFPAIGHFGVVDGAFEMVVPRLPFVIVYRTDGAHTSDTGLVVLRVYHCAQLRS